MSQTMLEKLNRKNTVHVINVAEAEEPNPRPKLNMPQTILEKLKRKSTMHVIDVAEKHDPNGRKDWDAPDVAIVLEKEFDNEFGKSKQKGDHRKLFLTGLTDDCGISGVKHVFSRSILASRRILWITVLIASIVLVLYQVSEMIDLYLSHPINVNMNLKYVSELKFPAVAVCNVNKMRKSKTDAANLTELLSNMYTRGGANFSQYDISNTASEEFYAEMAHDKQETILSAIWKHEFIEIDTFQTIYTDFGVCYAFNTGNDSYGIRTVADSGVVNGLTLYLDTRQDDYNAGSQLGVGFQLVVYEQGDVPLVADLGFGAGVGEDIRVGLELTNITNLPPPHGVCGSRTLKYYSKYTNNACRTECFTDHVVSTCGCRAFYMPGPARVCDLEESFLCADYYAKYFFVRRETGCDCPVPCSRIIYNTNLSHVKFPSKVFYDLYKRAFNNSVDLENLLKVDIFFQELGVEEITQQKSYGFFQLLCDIGGSLGLWLGGSILTIVEIFDISLKGCFNRCWH